MDGAAGAAFIGLIGVALGAGISTFVQYRIAKEQRAAAYSMRRLDKLEELTTTLLHLRAYFVEAVTTLTKDGQGPVDEDQVQRRARQHHSLANEDLPRSRMLVALYVPALHDEMIGNLVTGVRMIEEYLTLQSEQDGELTEVQLQELDKVCDGITRSIDATIKKLSDIAGS